MELKIKQRISLSTYFFLSGLCFATWASRIPTIKTYFNFNEAELGTVLLAMPIASMVGLPISGWLVSKFNSRGPLLVAFIFFEFSLLLIGYAKTSFLLVVALCIFAFFMRILNIAMNAQSIILQKKFKKKIISAFHGLWSTGGLIGVGYSTLMVKMGVSIENHLLQISVFTFIVSIISYFYLLKDDKSPTGNKLIFGKPDPFIFYLGMLVFFAAICEGGMFDWSGVYFKEVIHEEVFTYGYLLFMICMAVSRFFSDKLMDFIGMPKTYIFSAVLIASGILTAIIFPTFWPALIGFCLVGIGTAPLFPMTFILAGTSSKYSPGMAISIISTYGIIGMLLGPPLIGYLAHALGLKAAFFIFVTSGILLIPFSKRLFRYQKKQTV
tara:strand:- start:7809 stop:8954 length:1146 start_codon:yes stop_codon:yes gene_type:complete